MSTKYTWDGGAVPCSATQISFSRSQYPYSRIPAQSLSHSVTQSLSHSHSHTHSLSLNLKLNLTLSLSLSLSLSFHLFFWSGTVRNVRK